MFLYSKFCIKRIYLVLLFEFHQTVRCHCWLNNVCFIIMSSSLTSALRLRELWVSCFIWITLVIEDSVNNTDKYKLSYESVEETVSSYEYKHKELCMGKKTSNCKMSLHSFYFAFRLLTNSEMSISFNWVWLFMALLM